MQKIAVRLADWDSPRNPELRVYVKEGEFQGTFRQFEGMGVTTRAIRACLPGKTADFINALLGKAIWQINVLPSDLRGYRMQIRLETGSSELQPPYTKDLEQIVALAEEWAGPSTDKEVKTYRAKIDAPGHPNHPLADEQIRLCRRFGVAMRKLAVA